MTTERQSVFQRHPKAATLVLFLIALLLAAAVGEAAVRCVERYQYAKLADRTQFQQYPELYADERGQPYVFGHKPNANVELTENGVSFTVVTNSEGLRETKEYEALDRSVIFLGDSIVEGASVENDEVMDEVFERRTGIPGLNLGVACYNTVHQYYWLKAKHKPAYNTRLVILGFCQNDFWQNGYLHYFDPSVSNWKLHRYLDDDCAAGDGLYANRAVQMAGLVLRQSRLVTFTRDALRKITKERGKTLVYYDHVNEKASCYTELYVREIERFTREIGAQLVVVIFPRECEVKEECGDQRVIQTALIEILDRNKIPYLDLFDLMRSNYLARPEVQWYHDDTHPYKEGHRVIGEYLAEKLPAMFPTLTE